MLKKIAMVSAMMVMLSGCYMVPMAFIGPATSSFSTASIIQSTITTSANYMVKKSTGKTITEHAIDALNENNMQQSYFPKKMKNEVVTNLRRSKTSLKK